MTDLPDVSARTAFRPRRLGHVNLYISEYEKSLHFYRTVLGLGDGWTRPGIGGAFLNNGATHHDVGFIPWDSPVTRKAASGPGLNHLGFELENEVEMLEDYRAALDAGVKYHATADHLIARSVYSWDPDGFGVEIYVDTEISYKQPDFLTLKRASGDWAPGMTPPSAEPRYVADHRPVKYPDSLFHATKLTGAVIVTEKFEALWDYYTGIVGLKPRLGGRDQAIASLGGSCGTRDVTLIRAGAGLEAGFHHANFSVFDEADLEDSLERAADFGVSIERRVDHPLRTGALLRDPDGLGILVYVDRASGAEREIERLPPSEALWLA